MLFANYDADRMSYAVDQIVGDLLGVYSVKEYLHLGQLEDSWLHCYQLEGKLETSVALYDAYLGLLPNSEQHLCRIHVGFGTDTYVGEVGYCDWQ